MERLWGFQQFRKHIDLRRSDAADDVVLKSILTLEFLF